MTFSGHPAHSEALQDKAFASIAVPARPGKPRRCGQTVAADKGLGVRAAQDMLDVAGDYIDWVKLAGSSVRLLDPGVLTDKIDLYTAHDVQVLIAGDVLELALRAGVADQVWSEVQDHRAHGVEIATAQVSLSLDDHAALVGRATQRGLHVFAEVGRKGEGHGRPHPSWVARQVETLLQAGAYRVVLQGEGVTENVDQIDADLIFAVAAQSEPSRIVWQAKNVAAQSWLIKEFGPTVNVDVESSQVLMLEARRRGVREQECFARTATAAETEKT